MKVRAKESVSIQKLRRKLGQRLAEADAKVTEAARKKMLVLIRRDLVTPGKISLKSRSITSGSKNSYVNHLQKTIQAEQQNTRSTRNLAKSKVTKKG